MRVWVRGWCICVFVGVCRRLHVGACVGACVGVGASVSLCGCVWVRVL